MDSIKSAADRLYGGAAFGSVHFDGIGHRAAISASLNVLDLAQSECLDRPIEDSEINEACSYLMSQSDKAAILIETFRDGLRHKEPYIRFEATSRALRGIRSQFGH